MISKELSIIIPAYLEEENLRIVIPRLNHSLRRYGIDYEILVVDTMQKKDNTGVVCEQNDARYINRGGGDSYGDAVRTGIEEAAGRYIMFMDADGSHSPEMAPELLKHRNEYDVVIASRYVPGGGSDNSKILIAMSYIVNRLYSIVLGLECRDVSNSFKVYRAADLKSLTLHCGKFDIIEEILVKLKRRKFDLQIMEVPYFFKERMFGHTKRNLLLFMLFYLKTLLVLKFKR